MEYNEMTDNDQERALETLRSLFPHLETRRILYEMELYQVAAFEKDKAPKRKGLRVKMATGLENLRKTSYAMRLGQEYGE
jgi:ribosomal protein S24E